MVNNDEESYDNMNTTNGDAPFGLTYNDHDEYGHLMGIGEGQSQLVDGLFEETTSVEYRKRRGVGRVDNMESDLEIKSKRMRESGEASDSAHELQVLLNNQAYACPVSFNNSKPLRTRGSSPPRSYSSNSSTSSLKLPVEANATVSVRTSELWTKLSSLEQSLGQTMRGFNAFTENLNKQVQMFSSQFEAALNELDAFKKCLTAKSDSDDQTISSNDVFSKRKAIPGDNANKRNRKRPPFNSGPNNFSTPRFNGDNDLQPPVLLAAQTASSSSSSFLNRPKPHNANRHLNSNRNNSFIHLDHQQDIDHLISSFNDDEDVN